MGMFSSPSIKKVAPPPSTPTRADARASLVSGAGPRASVNPSLISNAGGAGGLTTRATTRRKLIGGT